MTPDAAILINALGMIACVVITIAMVVFVPKRRPTVVQMIALPGATFVLFVLVLPMMAHLCKEGGGVNQMVVGFVCAAILALTMRQRVVATTSWVVMVLAGALLGWQSIDLVHEDGWCGNPSVAMWVTASQLHRGRESLGHTLEMYGQRDVEVEEGWLRETLGTALPDLSEDAQLSVEYALYPVHVRVVGRAWHTWFTDHHPYEHVTHDFWHPGGFVMESLNEVSLRPRSRDGAWFDSYRGE